MSLPLVHPGADDTEQSLRLIRGQRDGPTGSVSLQLEGEALPTRKTLQAPDQQLRRLPRDANVHTGWRPETDPALPSLHDAGL